MFYCNLYRLFPSFDARRIERAKVFFWNVIVKAKWGLSGTETTFDFKYVPQYDTCRYTRDRYYVK